jgi:hypothetical protein
MNIAAPFKNNPYGGSLKNPSSSGLKRAFFRVSARSRVWGAV